MGDKKIVVNDKGEIVVKEEESSAGVEVVGDVVDSILKLATFGIFGLKD